MVRVPYEIVAPEADRLIVRVALARNWEQSIYYWTKYLIFIEGCGWTNQEYDRETLKRIDAAWVELRRSNWN